MNANDQIFADDLIIKTKNKFFNTTEYYLSNNKIVNIIVNQTTENLEQILEQIKNYLLDKNYKIFSQFLFANSFYENENKILAEKYFNSLTWPVTVIKQDDNIWGTIITAIKSNQLETIYQNNNVIGNVFQDEYADYCYLGGLANYTKKDAKSLFQIVESELNRVEMHFNNIIRTWFYLNNLISWYDEFNKERSDYFVAADIFNNMIPASTGISASNNENSNLLSSVFSVKTKKNNIKIFSVVSPLQCPAVDYKSSFSRAVEIDHPDYRQLIISGTASIDPEGNTAHVGDIYKQISLTMEVVKAILNSRNMVWENVTKGIVYFKDIADIKTFNDYCEYNNITNLPLAMLKADICREELLFEIEMDAVEIKNN